MEIHWFAGGPVLDRNRFLERLGMMVKGVGSKEAKIKKAPEQIAVVISILNLLSH